jgi:uncharacterized Fe-S center protein
MLLFMCEAIQKADVFFTKDISPSSMVKLFKKLNVKLTGKIGLKVHSGEIGGKYFLSPNFLQEIYDYTNGTFIECNTAYRAGRHSTEEHRKVLAQNGWLDNNRRTVIMDEDPSLDFNLSISNPVSISENIVGSRLKEFDSCLVLSHFKGHGMGGYGGALKQLSIGFASQKGKTWIHTAGKLTDWTHAFTTGTTQIEFTSAMGDSASSIVNYFRERGGIAFISVVANISKSCDCAGASAPAPKIKDIGILASIDPIAIDRAGLDLIKKYTDEGTEELLSQIKRLEGENTVFVAEKHGIGSQEYNFIDVDSDPDSKPDSDPDSKPDSGSDSKPETNTGSESNNTMTIVIICIVIFAVIVIAVVIGLIIYRKRNQEPSEKEKENTAEDNKLMDE